jgi:uncharacterized protein
MATSYKTPGVYVEEIPKFPPSVAEVETAIPVFVGFTEKADRIIEGDLFKKPFRISSFLEYESYFGEPLYQAINVTVSPDGEPVRAVADSPTPFLMYYAVRSFFDNGGGPCYIFSIGSYADKVDVKLYDDSGVDSALNMIKKIDEITLLVFPDLACLGDSDKYYNIYQKALIQCGDLKDRFTIMDVFPVLEDNADKTDKILNRDDSINGLRDSIGTTELKYGAAYFPYLKSTYNYSYSNANIKFIHKGKDKKPATLDEIKYDDVILLLNGAEAADIINKAMTGITADNVHDRKTTISKTWENLQFNIVNDDATVTSIQTAVSKVLSEMDADPPGVSAPTAKGLNDEIKKYLDAVNNRIKAVAKVDPLKSGNTDKNVSELEQSVSPLFQTKVDQVIGKLYVELPPSASMAGLYAYVDRTRGVWKAPANVSVQSIIEPVYKVSDAEQADLNVHTSGKSINVIRAFTGRGVQVWGARTLAGNDNEWRYIPVRRFFNMVEESVKKATEPFVFEPNDANTWVKVKAMIENFLILQWREGALAGAKPEQAFYVAVGLNQTMTAQDILEGRMIVEIGMAVVRPAEFIILRFSHKMQES